MSNLPQVVEVTIGEQMTLQSWRDADGEIVVGVRWACEQIGVNWTGQLSKIRDNPLYAKSLSACSLLHAGQRREIIGLPLDLFLMFLASISAKAVSERAREPLLLFQRESAKALRDYWSGGIAIRKQAIEITDPDIKKALELVQASDVLVDLFGVPKHVALTEQTKLARRETGLDFSNYLIASPYMDGIEASDLMLEPTELGRHFGLSGSEMNKRLEAIRLQSKINNQWVATDHALGSGLAAIHYWQRGTKTGYNLKWRLSEIKKLMESGPRAIEGGTS